MSVVDLAALPQGGVGDVLRAVGGGIVFSSPVLAGAARREAREKAVIGRTGKRAPFGTSSIRRAHGGRRRPAEVIESLRNSWEPIDARSGRVQEDRSLVHLVEILSKLGSQPENLLLHDGHMQPDLVDPPGLAADMASGGPEAEHQQEIPVI